MVGCWGCSEPSGGRRPLGLTVHLALPLRLHLQVPPFAFLKALLLVLGLGLWITHRNRPVRDMRSPGPWACPAPLAAWDLPGTQRGPSAGHAAAKGQGASRAELCRGDARREDNWERLTMGSPTSPFTQ